MQKTILGQVLGQVLRLALNTQYLTDPGVGGGEITPPSGFVFLSDPDGEILTDGDGEFLMEAA